MKCTDGASKNFDHGQADKLVESTCNAHALLKFRDIRDKYPAEYAEAGRVYKQVFDNDDKAKALGLGPIDRMLYHRQHSKPLMQQLKAMCEEKIKSKLVEPSSPLWEPLTFVVNQWAAQDQDLQLAAERPEEAGPSSIASRSRSTVPATSCPPALGVCRDRGGCRWPRSPGPRCGTPGLAGLAASLRRA